MADIQSNIRVNVDTSGALASIKALQRQISAFHTSMNQGGAAASAQAAMMRQNLINGINASGKFAASVQRISSTTESFTHALERNRMSLGQYFRYAGGASKSFGRFFKSEMDTIEKVAISRVKSLQTQYIKLGRDANGAMRAIAVRPLALDMQNLSTKTAIAAQKQQLLNQLLKQGSTNLLNFGKNTQWAGRQLMVGFTIPLAIMASASMKAFKQMEEQAVKFKRVYGDTFTSTEETDKMIKQVQTLAAEFTKYGVEVQKTMEMASTAAAAGKTGADLLAQVSSATRLAVLGNIEQSKALETTISLTNAFGTSAQELGKKINFLNAVENQTVTNIEDLTTAIPKAAPVIKQLGGSVEDLAFFLTAMKEGGINASEGANALKSGLAALINPTSKASKMLSGFGINLEGIVTKNKGNVKNLVVEFGDALNKLDPLKRAQAIEQLFGKFQFARLSTLFQNVTKDGTQASRVLELTKKTSVELAALSNKELRSIQSSPLFKFQAAIANFKKEIAPVGEEFMKALTPLINFGTDILKNFNKLEPGMKQFIVNTTGIIAGLGPVLLMTFGLIANGVANLIKGFAFVKNVFNRASTASTVLGETTSFMTSEQIKAAAVAASLQQAHNKLTQSFTVEASALSSLTAAYQKATAAQTTYMTGSTTKGKSTARNKFASGVVSVPGPKGAGDIVPAMLAPGEAVIPAKMVSKYKGLINGMVSGTIPGFNGGRTGSSDTPKKRVRRGEGATFADRLKAETPKDAPEYIRKQNATMTWASKKKELAIMERTFAEMGAPINDPNFGKVAASHTKTTFREVSLGRGITRQIKEWFTKHIMPDLGIINKSLADLSNPDIENIKSKSSVSAKTYKEFVASIPKIAKKAGVTEAKARELGMGMLKGEIHPKDAASSKIAKELFGIAAKHSTTAQQKAKYTASSRIMDSRLKDKTKGSFLSTVGERVYKGTEKQRIAAEDRKIVKMKKVVAEATATEIKNYKTLSSKTRQAINVTEERSKATKEQTKTTKKATELEKRGITQEQRRQKAENRVAKAKAEIAAGTRKSFTPAQAKAQSYLTYGADKPTKDQREARRTEQRIAREAIKARGAQRRAEIDARLAEKRNTVKNSRNMRSFGGKMSGLSMAGMIAGGMAGGDIGGIISNVSGIAFAVSSLVSIFPSLGAAIAAFLPEIAIAALAITGFAVAMNLATKQERERIQHAKDVAEAVDITDKKKQAVTDFFGKTLSDRYFKSAATVGSDLTDPQTAAVKELRLNEAFKEQYATTVKALQEGTDEQIRLILSNLSLGLSSDLAPDEIAVLIQALQQEAGKTSFTLDFASIDVTSAAGRSGAQKLVQTELDKLRDLAPEDVTSVDAKNQQSDAELKRQIKEALALNPDKDATIDLSRYPELAAALEAYQEATAQQFMPAGSPLVDFKTPETANAADVRALVEGTGGYGDLSNLYGPQKGTEEQVAQAQAYAGILKSTMEALRGAYDDGAISQEEFLQGLIELRDGLSGLGATNAFQAQLAVEEFLNSVKTLTPEIKNGILGLTSLGDQFNVTAAFMVNSSEALAAFTAYLDELKKPWYQGKEFVLAAKLKLVTDIGTGALKDEVTSKIQETYDEIGKAIDNIQTGLDIIGLKEDKINDKYDKRLDALDKIQKANETISQQQQDQLNIAEAITRGDVAGAARAMQQARANSADRALQDQRDAIEASRASDLAALTDPSGRNRTTLEALLSDQKMKQLLLQFSNPDKFATGGHIRGPGTGTSDSIPAMLSNGEYVIRAKAAKAIGVDALNRMNHAEKFMTGGPVNIAKYATGGHVLSKKSKYPAGDPRNYDKAAQDRDTFLTEQAFYGDMLRKEKNAQFALPGSKAEKAFLDAVYSWRAKEAYQKSWIARGAAAYNNSKKGKYAMGGPVNIAKYAKGGPVNVAKYRFGGAVIDNDKNNDGIIDKEADMFGGKFGQFKATPDNMKAKVDRDVKGVLANVMAKYNPYTKQGRRDKYLLDNQALFKWNPFMQQELMEALARKNKRDRDAMKLDPATIAAKSERDKLYKQGGPQGFLAGVEGMMSDIGASDFGVGFSTAMGASGYNDFIMSTLSLPVEIVGSAVHRGMKNASDLLNGKATIGSYLQNSLGVLTDPFVNTYGHLADPNREFRSGFQQAGETVIENGWFGTKDNKDQQAWARIIAGSLDIVGDPINYTGAGLAVSAASKAAKAASLAAKAGKFGKVVAGTKAATKSMIVSGAKNSLAALLGKGVVGTGKLIGKGVVGTSKGIKGLASGAKKLMIPSKKPAIPKGSSQFGRYMPQAYVRFMRSNPSIAVRARSDQFLEKLASGDLNYRNTMDQKAFEGITPTMANSRFQVEKDVFGIPEDAPGSVRPIYGAAVDRYKPWSLRTQKIKNTRRGAKKQDFRMLKGSYSNIATHHLDTYGDIALLLKNSVKKRSTFTLGDTYGSRSIATSVSPAPIVPAKFGTFSKKKILNSASEKFTRRRSDLSFVEAQIFDGLPFSDIQKIIVRNPEIIPFLKEQLAAAGLKIPVGERSFNFLGTFAEKILKNKKYKKDGNRTNMPLFVDHSLSDHLFGKIPNVPASVKSMPLPTKKVFEKPSMLKRLKDAFMPKMLTSTSGDVGHLDPLVSGVSIPENAGEIIRRRVPLRDTIEQFRVAGQTKKAMMAKINELHPLPETLFRKNPWKWLNRDGDQQRFAMRTMELRKQAIKFTRGLVRNERLAIGPKVSINSMDVAATRSIEELTMRDFNTMATGYQSNRPIRFSGDPGITPRGLITGNRRYTFGNVNKLQGLMYALGIKKLPPEILSQFPVIKRYGNLPGANGESLNALGLPTGPWEHIIMDSAPSSRGGAFVPGHESSNKVSRKLVYKLFGKDRTISLGDKVIPGQSIYMSKEAALRDNLGERPDLRGNVLLHEMRHTVEGQVRDAGMVPTGRDYVENMGVGRSLLSRQAVDNAYSEAYARNGEAAFTNDNLISPYNFMGWDVAEKTAKPGSIDSAYRYLRNRMLLSDSSNAFVKNYLLEDGSRSHQFPSEWWLAHHQTISQLAAKTGVPTYTVNDMQHIKNIGETFQQFGITGDAENIGVGIRNLVDSVLGGLKGKNAPEDLIREAEGFLAYIDEQVIPMVAASKKSGSSSTSMSGMSPESISPIIKGVFETRSSPLGGISAIGNAKVGGADFFMKRVGNRPDALAPWLEHLPETGIVELLTSQILRGSGMNVPDLKLFPDMSGGAGIGMVLGSKALENARPVNELEGIMRHLRIHNPEERDNLFSRMITSGLESYAANDAVANAIIGNTDTHWGNILFNLMSGDVSSLDFGRTALTKIGALGEGLSGSTALRLRTTAQALTESLQSKIMRTATDQQDLARLFDHANVPYLKNIESEFRPQDFYLTTGHRSVDIKPMAERMSKALGFDLSQTTLPRDFAIQSPIMRQIQDALSGTGVPMMDAGRQQTIFDELFANIKAIMDSEHTKFKYANGGMVGKPRYFANGGLVGMYANGGDVVPSMLTPGEFIVSQPAVKDFGVNNLKALNNGTYNGDSMYNYSVNLSVNGSNANADEIARKVMKEIKRVDSQRVGGVRA